MRFIAEKWFPPRLRPYYWTALAVLILVLDYLAEPELKFQFLFILPVALASWFSGREWGLTLAILIPVARFGYMAMPQGADYAPLAVNALIRISVLGVFAYFLDRTAIEKRTMAKRLDILEGLLPVCSHCKNIRNKENIWEPMEKYIQDHSQAEFTHGVCPACREKYYGHQLSKSKSA